MTMQTASINRKELFLRASRGEALPRVPVWMMRQSGRYLPEYREIRAKHPFLEVCKTPQLTVKLSIQPFRQPGVESVIVSSHILIPRMALATIPYLRAQIAAGATAVQLFDTWCGELNLQDYENFALPAVQEIIAGLGGSVPAIYYTKASQHLLPAVSRSGANVLSVDWRVDLAEIRKTLGPKVQ